LQEKLNGDFDLRNSILKSLRPDAVRFLEDRAILRRLSQGDILHDAGSKLTHAVFPHEGVVSMMADTADGRGIETVSVGNEGFIGICCILGGGTTNNRAVVQVEGYGSWISIADLDEAYTEFPCVGRSLLRYTKALTGQLMESVACNTLHSAEQRVSRWLLSAHDRVSTDSFHLTQQALSELLGLRRGTVNATSRLLMKIGAIKYHRGIVSIEDRSLLESKACSCHSRIRTIFETRSSTDEIENERNHLGAPVITA